MFESDFSSDDPRVDVRECPWDADGSDEAAWDVNECEAWDAAGTEPLPTRELLAHLLTLTPDLLVMHALAGIELARLDGDDAVTYLRVLERVIGHLHAVQAEALVAAASPERLVEDFTLLVPDSDEERTIRIEDAVREELAAALRWSPTTAQHRIDTGRLLAGPLAATRAALAAGEITSGHVNVIVESACRLPGRWMRTPEERETFTAACSELQRRVLPTATRGTLTMTRAAGKRAVLAIDAEGERRRREQARCTRDVWVSDQLDGISILCARMATEQAHAVMTQIDAIAHADSPADNPLFPAATTMGERRVEALAALVLSGASDGAAVTGLPVLQVRAHLDVVIDLPTLLGLAADLDDGTTGDGPAAAGCGGTGYAEIRGAGPVSADVVRDLLADPDVAVTMRRLVTDPVTGHLLDYGRRTYAIPQRLRDYIVARDRTCRFPTCNRRADRCQIDHATAWDDGGETKPQNLGALCVRHHQLKTHGGWDITHSRPDGSCTWTSPQGRQYDHDPPPY